MAAEAALLSLRVAAVATLASLPVAVTAAWALARGRFAGRRWLDLAVHMPLVLPPVVTGWLLLILFGTKGPVGAALESCCGIVLAFRWTGAALAAAVMAFPLLVRPIRLAIEAVPRSLEEQAADLGARPGRVAWTVTLPLALPGIWAGMALGFAKSLGEFGATITFAANIPGETRTIPSAIHALLQVPGAEGAVWGLVALSTLLAAGSLWLADALGRRAAARVRG